ncbi:MAG TPA: nickel-binding protein [Stellaceae bacterium]|nr:nickel-binding protein [Stellaceae bacterium]
MPIFMDRHELPGLGQTEIADAHRKDLQIQGKYGVKYLTYWWDYEHGTGFCLVDAPDAATAERVHREAHGAVANAIIPVDLTAVEAFLGRIGDPHAKHGARPKMDAGLRAVMFTDIVGSTEMTARLGDAAALELVRVHDSLVRRGLAAFGGREIKHTGDGIMASYSVAIDAIRSAADIQQRFAAFNAETSKGLSVRIGISAGEPVEDHNDLFGVTVQLAYRLCSEAEANGILVSTRMHELCAEKAAHFVPLGVHRLKGFAQDVPLYRFEWRGFEG